MLLFWAKLMSKKNKKSALRTIHAERDSVCMGDDCNAPNTEEIPYNPNECLYEFLVNRVAKYVPAITNSVWVITSGAGKEVGYITFYKNCDVTCTLATKRDIYVYELGGSIFCRKYNYKEIEDKHPKYKSLLK